MDNDIFEEELPAIKTVVFEEDEEEERDEQYYLDLNANRVLVHYAEKDKVMRDEEEKVPQKKKTLAGTIGNFIYHHRTAVIIVSVIAAVAVLWFATL